MSLDPILWAMKDAPVADVQEFAILLVQAESADEDGCNAFQSTATIAGRTKLSEKTVQRRLDTMQARGLICPGDQEYPLLLEIRADKRPTNYDLMIPWSWWGSKWRRMNQWRAERNRVPLQPQERPDLGSAPEAKRRADLRAVNPPRGDYESPRPDGGTTSHPADGGTTSHPEDAHGGTTSPPRGDYQSGHGGTTSPPTLPIRETHPRNQPAADAAAARTPAASTAGALFDVPTAPPPGTDPRPETTGQRVNRLTRTYVDAVPLSNFLAVAGVVRKAVTAARDGRPIYSDTEIVDALKALADENRGVTTETLRIALEGLPPRPTVIRPARVDVNLARGMDIAARLRATEASTPPTRGGLTR